MSGAARPAWPAATGTDTPLPAGVVPEGTLQWCAALLQRAADVLTNAGPCPGGPRWVVDPRLVEAHLLAPWVIAAANELPPPAPPLPPWPAPGGGWVDVDLGPDDHGAWPRLLEVLEQEVASGVAAPPGAEELARRAQEWRLAVVPYRPAADHSAPGAHGLVEGVMAHPPGTGAPAQGPPAARTDTPLAGITVVDLTVLWAGPLATWLLAQLGATVVKVEPGVRPDGLRRGARADAAGPGDGALFVALDHGKVHRKLDLREAGDLAVFLELVAGADIVVDNFTRRVRPNLGIEPARLRRTCPRLIDLSLRAFDAEGPEVDWVAHGGGVHAMVGAAAAGPQGPAPALVSYPDPVAGFSAFLLLVTALATRQRGGSVDPMVLSLESSLRPILRARHRAPSRDGSTPGETRTRRALWRWAHASAAVTADRVVDGCRVLPPPLRLATGTTP